MNQVMQQNYGSNNSYESSSVLRNKKCKFNTFYNKILVLDLSNKRAKVFSSITQWANQTALKPITKKSYKSKNIAQISQNLPLMAAVNANESLIKKMKKNDMARERKSVLCESIENEHSSIMK